MRSNLMTLPQLHRFGRTSLVRLQIRNYRLVVLFMIKICTLFVCYDCIGYFSRFAYTLTHIACFHESVNIQMVLQILWLQFVIIIIAVSIQSNLTADGNILDSECLQIHLYQTDDCSHAIILFLPESAILADRLCFPCQIYEYRLRKAFTIVLVLVDQPLLNHHDL